MHDAIVARRMRWASKRSTARVEDTAYSLLGLFDVSIPLLYGEGIKAFQCLQHAIISQPDDESIFAWLSSREEDERGMLAASPSEFAATGLVRPIHFDHKRPPAMPTSRGLEIHHNYAHPMAMVWGKFFASTIGRPLFLGSANLRLRLDCELANHRGVDYWIGISLCYDMRKGSWFRQDASKLLYGRQNKYFKKVYPAFAGFKKIYVEPPKRVSYMSARGFPTDTFSRYNRPVSISLLWQVAEILSGSSSIWLMNT